MTMLTLHDFHRSSASFRVRIALNLKNVAYTSVVQDLDARAHRATAYLALNPQGLLPALQIGDHVLTQSSAIVEYLDDQYPEPPLLPAGALERARVRALFQTIASDTHPVTAMRVAQYLKQATGCADDLVLRWKQHWIVESLAALETMLAGSPGTGRFCHGDRPSLADIALVPQIVSARNVGVDITPYPTVSRIHDACMQLAAFRDAHPDTCSSNPAYHKE
ncbi:maleylacetoacetate isomerase [Burkholderia ubonensis]|uniref:Maleylacetoacetate isomerase n=1 Tax=Burkholderia ubonensis TaxID=101571 RepID=A0ABD4E1Q7_9BURK|nr:maleylacetoacetate isomerase [Burkholderia ubonensis]KVM14825.1 maleylacetoacetate isomerase [Burkholderia ubonensis]KVM41898.1 maleylacetoacetate isomerase [Burkholderia ubonensis]KVN83581.1 maleylacetoacetate isomerase [Burkholderia ubonensis]KVN93869.1 maleylacetoacetate isomerase [Burkholderia ubonensis]